jgi:hypothetical protein
MTKPNAPPPKNLKTHVIPTKAGTQRRNSRNNPDATLSTPQKTHLTNPVTHRQNTAFRLRLVTVKKQ